MLHCVLVLAHLFITGRVLTTIVHHGALQRSVPYLNATLLLYWIP